MNHRLKCESSARTVRRKLRNAAMILFLAALTTSLQTSCSSTTPGGSYLYAKETEPAVLLDSELVIETFHNLRNQKRGVEKRVVRLVNGVPSAEITKPRLAGAARLDFETYASIWRELVDGDYKKMEMEAIDTSGGPYHIVTATLGRDLHQFSAQYTTNILGLNDSFRNQPVEMLNEILRILEAKVRLERIETQPSEPKSP